MLNKSKYEKKHVEFLKCHKKGQDVNECKMVFKGLGQGKMKEASVFLQYKSFE